MSPGTTSATRDVAAPPPPAAAEWRFGAVAAAEIGAVQDFIRRAFRRAYDAEIEHFLPEPHALYRGDALMAACGLRPAVRESLFLERYLDCPVEHALELAVRQPVTRAAIVEVGNLAIARAGTSRPFIAKLTAHLHERGIDWTVFTAVPALRNSFRRLRIPLATLGRADVARIPEGERAAWGRYYDQGPLVCAVKVEHAREQLSLGT